MPDAPDPNRREEREDVRRRERAERAEREQERLGWDELRNWYRNRFINLMAKEIYPIVTEYLASGRAMDKAFVDRYIQTYDTRFPEFLVDLEHVLLGR